MKIVSFSDSHGQEKEIIIPEGDVLIFAGDYQTSNKSGESFLKWFGSQPHKYKILVAGNHDRYLFNLGFDKAFEVCKKYNIIYLQDTNITIDGIIIHGSPRTPTFGSWAFMDSDYNLTKYWNMIHPGTDILITHGPPYNVGDLVYNNFGTDPHVGSKTLATRIQLLSKLKWHLFGHIHEGKRETTIDKYTSVNLSILNHKYCMVEQPYVLKTKGKNYGVIRYMDNSLDSNRYRC